MTREAKRLRSLIHGRKNFLSVYYNGISYSGYRNFGSKKGTLPFLYVVYGDYRLVYIYTLNTKLIDEEHQVFSNIADIVNVSKCKRIQRSGMKYVCAYGLSEYIAHTLTKT